jgi:hypothetical protein
MTNQQPTERLSSFPEHFHPDIIEIGGVKYQRIVKPQTLYEIIREWNDNEDYPTCEELVSRIEDWISRYKCDYVVCAEYLQGYNALMETLKANLK